MEINKWLRNQWDRAAAVVFAVAGIVLLLLGWAGVSRVTLATQQIPYLASGGLFGMFCLGTAATLWLSADLRDEWRKLNDIHDAIAMANEQRSEVAVGVTADVGQGPPQPVAADAPVAGNGAASRGRLRAR